MQRASILNQFLNSRHSFVVRVLIGCLLSSLTLITTGKPILAREMFRRTYGLDQFRTAFRRVSFYARRSWVKFDISADKAFVFCSELSVPELKSLKQFLQSRAHAFQFGIIASDLSYVAAMLTVQSAGTPQYGAELDAYSKAVDLVLDAIAQSPADIPPPQDTAVDHRFDLANAEVALVDFSHFMASISEPWFVISGTFLGIVRENGFLPHDDDIDIGIYGDTLNVQSFFDKINSHPSFHCHGIDEQVTFSRSQQGHLEVSHKPVVLKVSHVGGIHIDVFVHYIEQETTWHASSLFRWDNSNFELTPYELAGVAVLGPKDADRYLVENYGEWKIPVTEFNSATDTTNQNVFPNPLSIAIFLRRIWLSKKRDPHHAAALMALLERRGFISSTGQGTAKFKKGFFQT